MFEITSDVSMTVPMVMTSVLSTAIASFFSEHSWAHTLLHLPDSKLPHHKVLPIEWTDRLLETSTEVYGDYGNRAAISSGKDQSSANPLH